MAMAEPVHKSPESPRRPESTSRGRQKRKRVDMLNFSGLKLLLGKYFRRPIIKEFRIEI
jgi:hypothetical protein